MRRGDLVTVALRGDAGKPRPALVVQAEDLFGSLPTIVVLPLTSVLADLPLTRVTMKPTETNGLRAPSQVMVSRPQSALREQIGAVIGHADESVMVEVGQKLALLMGLTTGISESVRTAKNFLNVGPGNDDRRHRLRFTANRRQTKRT